MVKFSLRIKLSVSYLLVAMISVVLVMVLTNMLLDSHFRKYVNRNQEKRHREVVTSVSQQYLGDGKWNADMVEVIGVSALESGLIIKVKDISGKIIWDATAHNNGMCQRIIEHMAKNVSSRYPDAGEIYREVPTR